MSIDNLTDDYISFNLWQTVRIPISTDSPIVDISYELTLYSAPHLICTNRAILNAFPFRTRLFSSPFDKELIVG